MKKYSWMSSAAVVIGALSVKPQGRLLLLEQSDQNQQYLPVCPSVTEIFGDVTVIC